jgi:uncharacterized protein (DUF169 family)
MEKRVDWERIDRTIRGYLGLRYHLVGVKIRGKDIGEKESEYKPDRPMAHCQMIREIALQGGTYIYDKSDEACPTAHIILGLRPSKRADMDLRIKPAETKSIVVASLDNMKEEPDVILATLTPKQMMDLATVLQAGNPDLLSVGFRGEASCAEFTAKPFMEHEPNLSLLCNGARTVYSDFRDNELLFGAPPETYLQAADVIEKITKTGGALCGCRTSDIPQEVTDTFERAGLAKGTDYFFGRMSGRSVRAYLNKDLQGRLEFITFHLPVKMSSNEEAAKAVQSLSQVLSSPFLASSRGPWLDVTVSANLGGLSIDLLEEKSIGKALTEFVNKSTEALNRVKV